MVITKDLRILTDKTRDLVKVGTGNPNADRTQVDPGNERRGLAVSLLTWGLGVPSSSSRPLPLTYCP
jgi:hypothetical protein